MTERQESRDRLARAASAAKQAFMGHEPSTDDTVWERIVLAVRGADGQAGQATREGQGRRSAGRGAAPTDYLETFRDFWAEIVGPLDKLDADKVARELHDYSHVMSEVPEVYGHVSGGAMSYVTYYAADVCAVADAYYGGAAQDLAVETAREARIGLLEELIERWAVLSVGNVHGEAIMADLRERLAKATAKSGVE